MKRIVATGDWHCGSRFGLATPEYVSEKMRLRSDCLTMYERFCAYRDNVGPIDRLFLMGDLCDGWNPKEHADDRTVEEKMQVEMASELAKTFQGSPKIYAVDGSGYHRGTRRLDNAVAQAINAIPSKYGRYARPAVLLDVEGVRFSFAHMTTVSRSSWQYRTTPLALRLVLSRLSRLERENHPYVLLRGHCHTFTYAGFKTQFAATVPAFQTCTPFIEERSPENTCDVGFLFFQVEGDDYTWRPYVEGWMPEVVEDDGTQRSSDESVQGKRKQRTPRR